MPMFHRRPDLTADRDSLARQARLGEAIGDAVNAAGRAGASNDEVLRALAASVAARLVCTRPPAERADMLGEFAAEVADLLAKADQRPH